MDELIKAIQSMIGGARAEFNKAISKLPPLEQFEANQSLAWGFNYLQSTCSDFVSQLIRLDGELMAKLQGAVVLAEKAGVEKAIGEKAVIRFADHEALVNTAAEAARVNERETLTQAFNQTIKAQQGRAKLLEGVAASVAEKVPDALLVGDHAEANAKVVKERLAKLVEAGCTTDNSLAFQQAIAGLGLDEAGNAEFETRCAPIFAIAKSKGAPPKATTPPNPAAGSTGGSTVKAEDFA